MDNVAVGNKIAALRKQSKLTQEELAEKVGITAQAISKWENGHTLPETALLPLLAQILNCSIDSMLLPFAAQDTAFQDFADAVDGKSSEFALLLYQKMKDRFSFTISYKNEYNVFDAVFNSCSSIFNNPDKDDFIIRMDIENDNIVVRLALQNCSNYMRVINDMPEYVKANFRCNDCKSCQCNKCPYTMIYTFEGVDYKQCHFITLGLNSTEDVKHIFALLCEEHRA